MRRPMGSTERLTTEALGLEHAADLFQALRDERVGRYIGGPDVTTLEALQDRITRLGAGPPDDRDELWLNFAVIFAGDVIGRIEATLHGGVAEIAYVFGPAWWGRGYATEAVSWLLSHLAGRSVSVVWTAVAPGNAASVRLLERLGFAPTRHPTHLRLLSYDDGDLVLSRPSGIPMATGRPRDSDYTQRRTVPDQRPDVAGRPGLTRCVATRTRVAGEGPVRLHSWDTGMTLRYRRPCRTCTRNCRSRQPHPR